jgi:hypothetical protein
VSRDGTDSPARWPAARGDSSSPAGAKTRPRSPGAGVQRSALGDLAARYRRLVVATGLPSAALARVGIDPLSTPAGATKIVKAHVGPKAWRMALAAPTLPARAAILLPAIDRRLAADEAPNDTSTTRLRAARRAA